MPVPLPKNPFPVDTNPCKAYAICLKFERRASNSGQNSPSPLVCARVLGYMLIHAPVETGRDHMAGAILECANDDALRMLGEFYYVHIISLCGL